VRCGRCGNENADTNRYCGMCGAPLLPAPAQAATAAPVASRPVAGPPPAPVGHTEARPYAPIPADDGPVITGPSFLGLNKPVPSSGRGTSLRTSQNRPQDQLRSSRNLDYLLEDEEEPKHGFGKVLLILVALALALGFGYLRWKQGGFDWLTASAKKPAAAQTADASQPPADSAAAPPSTSAPSAPAGNANGSNADANSPAANPAASPATSAAASSPTANPAPSAASPAPDSSSTNNSASTSTPAAPTPTESGATQAKPSDSGASATPQAAPASDVAAAAPAAAPPKPVRTAKPTPVMPSDPVAEAERYIYGRGVRQDCDRGLRQLKPAAEQANSKAMVSLGALYATGVCTPRDLPTAYRWFALALRKQPDNEALQENLQKLWSQMTQPERQLAIKLSQ
jgi:TPR repeat protein